MTCQSVGEQITLLVTISSRLGDLSPLTPCSDDPAVGVLGGSNETGRREKVNAKEPHCYCMMASRIKIGWALGERYSLVLFARLIRGYKSRHAVPDLDREPAPF